MMKIKKQFLVQASTCLLAALLAFGIVSHIILADESETTDEIQGEESDEIPGEEELLVSASSSLHTAVWINGTSQNTISDAGKSMDMTPSSNNSSKTPSATATAQISFSLGSEDRHDVIRAGGIRIRIPRHAVIGRDGEGADTFTTAVPQAPEKANTHYFHYYIDEETDEIVFTNWQEFLGEQSFQAVIGWNYLPSDVPMDEDGTYSAGLPVTFEVDRTDENGESYTEKFEDSISLIIHTDAKFSRAQKLFLAKYDSWQSSWGTAPENSSDYFYVIWQGYWQVSPSSTEPFRVAHTEMEGADLVGWWPGGINVAANDLPASYFYRDGDLRRIEEYSEIISHRNTNNRYQKNGVNYQFPSTSFTAEINSVYFLVRYPKADYQAGDVVSNTETMTLSGIDHAADVREVEASFVYYPEGQEPYTGDKYSISKTWQNYRNFPYMKLLAGQTFSPTTAIYLRAVAKGYSLTMVDGVYGQKDYTFEFTDDFVEESKSSPVQLEAGDYYFSLISASLTCYDKDPAEYNNARVVKTISPALEIRSPENEEWHTVSSYSAAVSEQAYALRFRYTGREMYMSFSGTLRMTLLPSDHIKELLGKLPDDRLTYFPVRNIATLAVMDAEGNYINTAASSGQGLANSDRTLMRAHDAAKYGSGKNMLHAYASVNITDYPSHDNTTKEAVRYTNDTANSRYQIDYLCLRQQYVEDDQSLSPEDFLAAGTVEEYRNATFYDLLPAGSSYEPGSAKAYRALNATLIAANTSHTPSWVRKEELPVSCYTVETVANWRNSDRTMLIIHIDLGELRNYYSVQDQSEHDVGSGLLISFTANYPWTSLIDYGQSVRNQFVFRDNEKAIAGGSTDQASGTDAAYISDLDESGVTGDTERSFGYSNFVYTNLPLTGVFETGYTKAVRSLDEDTFSEIASVAGNGIYEYRLHLGTEPTGGHVKGVVFYDILEEMYGENEYWKGTFDSVDVQAAAAKGVDVKIYYSTAALDAGNPESWQDISDSGIWSRTEPEEKESVTAVAFDLSTKTNGQPYVMSPGENVMTKIRMKAPADTSPYLDPMIYAYNAPHIRQDIWTDAQNESEAVRSTEQANTVRVSLREPLAIEKESDPEYDPDDGPAKVSEGDSLTYTLTIRNLNAAETQNDIIVEDELPEGVEPVPDEIAVVDGNTETLLAEQGNVILQQDGQKLVFSISRIKAGGSISLKIPTEVTGDKKSLKNTADITSLDGHTIGLTSNPVLHELDTIVIPVLKVWEGKTGPGVTVVLQRKVGEEPDDTFEENLLLDEENEWRGEFRALPLFDEEGQKYEYILTELAVEGYITEITRDADGGFLVINTEIVPTPTPGPNDDPDPSEKPEEPDGPDEPDEPEADHSVVIPVQEVPESSGGESPSPPKAPATGGRKATGDESQSTLWLLLLLGAAAAFFLIAKKKES